MQQMALDAAESRPTTSAADVAPRTAYRRLPVGRRGQLVALQAQLARCDEAVQAAQARARRAMGDSELDESQRWDAVRNLRALAWKVTREIVPLVDRVPIALQADPAYIECQRATHVLRRAAEDALRLNANFTVDLVAAAQHPPRSAAGAGYSNNRSI